MDGLGHCGGSRPECAGLLSRLVWLHRLCLAALSILGLAACGPPLQTLRPALGPAQPELRAAIDVPPGPGPFPVVVLLHDAPGIEINLPGWASVLKAEGFLVVTPDQLTPRGFTPGGQTGSNYYQPGLPMHWRDLDTIDLVRFLQARPDVRPDRVFLVGFGSGGQLASSLIADSWRFWELDGQGSGTVRHGPAGAVNVYGPCRVFQQLQRPLFIVYPSEHSLADLNACQGLSREVPFGPRIPGPRAELLVLQGAYMRFDVSMVRSQHGQSATGAGYTARYSYSATIEAQRRAAEFLRRLRD